MLIWENIMLAINGIFSNRMRSILTMLGIIIGIGSVIAIMTVGNSLTLSVSENMQSMGANDVYVVLQEKSKENETSKNLDGAKFGSLQTPFIMNEEDAVTKDMIREMCHQFSDSIYAINVEYNCGSGTANFNNNSANINLTGTSVGYYVTNQLNMLGGRIFSENDYTERKNVALVSDKLVKKIFDDDVMKALRK